MNLASIVRTMVILGNQHVQYVSLDNLYDPYINLIENKNLRKFTTLAFNRDRNGN